MVQFSVCLLHLLIRRFIFLRQSQKDKYFFPKNISNYVLVYWYMSYTLNAVTYNTACTRHQFEADSSFFCCLPRQRLKKNTRPSSC